MNKHLEDNEDNLYSLPDDIDDIPSIDRYHMDTVAEYKYHEENDEGNNPAQISNNLFPQGPDSDADQEYLGSLDPTFDSRCWSILLKTLANPIEGWKNLRRDNIPNEVFSASLFYPIIAIASISEFVPLLYGSSDSITQILLKALAAFLSLFFGYFSVIAIGGIILPKPVTEVLHNPFGKEFVMLSISSLALFLTVFNIFPMFDAVFVFLPLWTLYIICRGVRFFRVPKDKESKIQIFLCFMILGLPCLWYWLCGILFPGV